MSDGKGKARAVSGDKETSITKGGISPQHPSILSSVATSALGLTKSAFTIPSTDEVHNLASVVASSSTKGSLPETNAGTAVWGESSKPHQVSDRSATVREQVQEGHSDEHIRKTENDFATFLDGAESFVISDHANNSHFTDHNYISSTESGGMASIHNSHSSQPVVRLSVSDQESHDGAAVLAILSAASADDEEFTILLEEDEKHDWGMSPAQLSHLKSLTGGIILEGKTHGKVAPNNPLNLIPDLQSGSSSQLTGLSDVTALNQWMAQWESVLTSYTDEVWGDLLPLVQEARQEIGIDKQPSTSNLRSLRRLEAILGHLQK